MGWTLVAVAVLAGMAIFSVGFRLTGQVTVIVGLLGLSAGALGFSAPRRWWMMAIGLGVGVGLHNLYPAPPYRQDAQHLALYGSPQPLPLPLGLTGNQIATTIAVVLILLSFLFVATRMGSIVRRVVA